jgi:hypothetical protein
MQEIAENLKVLLFDKTELSKSHVKKCCQGASITTANSRQQTCLDNTCETYRATDPIAASYRQHQYLTMSAFSLLGQCKLFLAFDAKRGFLRLLVSA